MNHIMKKLSVILPCYNVQDYVERAINSLRMQEWENLEIIAVNDGSQDNTLDVLKSIKKQFPELKILSQANKGYGTAVNAGMESATGDYVAILEPDDYLDNDYYSPLIATAEGLWADVVFYNSYFECRQGFKKRLVSLHMPSRFTQSSLLTDNEICQRLALGNVGICFAIYRRSFLLDNGITLNNTARAYEDVPFVGSVLNMAEKVAVIPGGGYHYNRDIPGQSVTNQSRFASILKVTQQFFVENRLKSTRESAIRGYFLKHLAVYWNKTTSAELKDCILALMHDIGHKNDLMCEEWTYQFIKSKLPKMQFNRHSTSSIVPNITPLKDLPPLAKVLSDGTYYQFMSFARYKLSRMLEENLPTVNFLNEMYCLLNIPEVEKNDMLKRVILEIFSREDFISLFQKNNTMSVKLMAKARMLDLIPDISVYCEDEKFAKVLLEDSQISSFSELKDVSNIKQYYHFFEKANVNSKDFLSYLQGKSIAIVGNSPCELNKNKGPQIDGHDVVIRFNNYEISDKTKPDYGSKISTWACTPTLESIRLREDVGCMDFILVPKVNTYMPKFRLDSLVNLAQSGINIGMFDATDYMKKYDMRIFSLGLLMILWLADNKEKFKSISIYGFSLTDQLDGVKHYFSGDPSAGKQLSFHKWSKEALILNSLIQSGVVKKC